MRLWRRLRAWRREAPAIGNPAEVGFETWYRLKSWQKALLVFLCVLAYVVCVAPTFTSNVLPHIMASVNADRSLNGGEIVQSVYLIGAVLLLTMAPLLMLHVSWAQAAGLLVMSLFIVYVNINNATGTIGHARDANADAPRQKIERIARLDSEIENGEKAYKQVPPHDYVLAATVKSAEAALATLKASADAECHSGTFGMTRGPRCSELEKRRDAKAEEVERLQQNADLTQRATDIEVALAQLRNERKTLGAAPEHIDAETERFVGFLALLHIVSADQAKAFSENKPVIDAITMELMAWFGTPSAIIGIFVLFGKMASSQREMDKRMLEVTQAVAATTAHTALATAADQGGIVLKDAPQMAANDDDKIMELEPDTPSPEDILEIEGDGMPAFVENPETVAEIVAAEVIKADPHKVRERKARRRKAASPDSVKLWHKERAFYCEGRKTQSKDATGDYERWCEDMNLTPVNRTVFGNVLKDELGIRKDGRGGRVKYINMGLRPAALRVVA